MKQSDLEAKFEGLARIYLPKGVIAEYKFCPDRKWKFDFAWPDKKVAAEIEGGVWSGGRHTRGSGFIKDIEKYNTALVMGWKVARFTSKDIDSKDCIFIMQKLLNL